MDRGSGCGRNSEIAKTIRTKCNFVDVLITLQKKIQKYQTEKEKISGGW